MITLAHHPTVQATIDRWRLALPVVTQLDQTQLTKEHLRLLIQMLIGAIESLAQPDHQPPTESQLVGTEPGSTINDERDPSSVFSLPSASKPHTLP